MEGAVTRDIVGRYGACAARLGPDVLIKANSLYPPVAVLKLLAAPPLEKLTCVIVLLGQPLQGIRQSRSNWALGLVSSFYIVQIVFYLTRSAFCSVFFFHHNTSKLRIKFSVNKNKALYVLNSSSLNYSNETLFMFSVAPYFIFEFLVI